jgi:hypothetical protein
MAEPDWKQTLSDAVEAAVGLNVDCGGTLGVHRVRDAVLHAIGPHIEAAYARGLMAGRSQQGYATRRKPREGGD